MPLYLAMIAAILLLATNVCFLMAATEEQGFESSKHGKVLIQKLQALTKKGNSQGDLSYAALTETEEGMQGELEDGAYYYSNNNYYYGGGYGGEDVAYDYYSYYGDLDTYNTIQTTYDKNGNVVGGESAYETVADEAFYIIIKDSHVIIIIVSVAFGLIICGSVIYYLIKKNYVQWITEAPIVAQRYSRLSTKDDDDDDVEMNNASVVSARRGAGDDVRRRKGATGGSTPTSQDGKKVASASTQFSDGDKDNE